MKEYREDTHYVMAASKCLANEQLEVDPTTTPLWPRVFMQNRTMNAISSVGLAGAI